jgi:hypothetical protein
VDENDSEEGGSADSASKPCVGRKLSSNLALDIEGGDGSKTITWLPPVLVMNLQPVVGQLGANSPYQLPLLNHGKCTALSVKWPVECARSTEAHGEP